MADDGIKRILKHFIFGAFYIFILCVFGFSLIVRPAVAEVIDRVVAVVNDDIITLFELNRKLQPYAERVKALGYFPEREREMLHKVREEMLDQLIDSKIKEQEIKRVKIKVGEEEIDNTIERVKEANFYTDEDLRAALTREGGDMQEYREQIKEQLLRSKLVNLEIKSKIVITQEDIKAYYDNHLEKYGGEKKYHLRNIIMSVSPFADKDKKQKIKTNMEEVLEKLNEGEPFETMVSLYSESPLAAKDGDLGWFALDQLSPRLREAIKGFKPGDYTPVIETDQGYQIFLVEDILQPQGKSLEEVTPEIEGILFVENVNKKFQSWLEELRKRANIKKIE
ncbi:MAG: SurA N-terminal domain-containing protein [Proteobacteria bacterium]|nr:SurA N-terminal domain-containing protein [Pseudomonadota bacterium]